MTPRIGYLLAAVLGTAGAFVFSGLAGASHTPDHVPEASWTCSSSVARLTLGTSPPIEPLVANANNRPCADDSGGLPVIALPPPPDSPAITAGLVSATTDVLCAGDDPDPDLSPAGNDTCDAGHHSFDQQVVSRAGVADLHIVLGTGSDALDIRAEVAKTEARAFCDDGNRPSFESDSTLVNVTINGTPIEIPSNGEPVELNLGIAKVVLNERVGEEGAQDDDATSGELIRRAIHVTVPASDSPAVDAVVAESKADFSGDVCPEGTVVVRKQTAPADPSPTFNFATTGGLTPASFTLKDDGEQSFSEVQPGTYTVSEGALPSGYELGLIECTDPTGNTATSLGTRTATMDVGPGETVTCTFVNTRRGLTTVCPPGAVPNAQGQCVVQQTVCPPGAGKNPQGQCVITNVRCPEGTIFDPRIFACIEGPEGGKIVPLGEVRGHQGSPCRDPRFGASFAIVGTEGRDRITGTNLSDRIFALGGDDRVSGGRGDDCVEGDSGRDSLDGSNGNDLLLGGSGRDSVSGGLGRDQLFGGSGRDKLTGGASNDVLRGGGGNDRLQGDFGNDLLMGGAGADGIHTGNGRDRVFAGPGNDIINAGTRGPAAFVDCGPGRDRVRINRNEVRRTRNCEFIDLFRRIRSG